MNFSTLFNVAKFAISKTPETALEIIKNLSPLRWRMTADGQTAAILSKPKFRLDDILKKRMLVLELEYSDATGNHTMLAATRFKNDGSDSLVIDGVTMKMNQQGFDLDTKPFRRFVRVQIPFATPSGDSHLIELSNNF